MKRFLEKSNWISYKHNSDGTYTVHNHLTDEDIVMTQEEINFLDKLNGEVDPFDILQREIGLTGREALKYVYGLMDYGILRRGNRVLRMSFMRTVVKIYNSQRYRELSIVLLGLQMISFIPTIMIGVKSAYRVFILHDAANYSCVDGPYWLGVLVGFFGGLLFHELNHAMACCSFGGLVMEFGFTFRGFPAVYTMIDEKTLSRCGQIVTGLAGVQANFMIAAISMCIYYHFGVFPSILTPIASINLELALVNLLFIEGFDGYNAMSILLGVSDAYERCKEVLQEIKAKSGSVSESDKIEVYMYLIFSLGKLICPLLIMFNLCAAGGVAIKMLKKAFGANVLFLISSLIIVLYSGNVWHIGLFVAIIYLFVAYSNECRGFESIWIFMLVAVGFIPINVMLEMRFHKYIFLLTSGVIGKILSVVIIYIVLFSLEEILAGMIGRIIWRHQIFDE